MRPDIWHRPGRKNGLAIWNEAWLYETRKRVEKRQKRVDIRKTLQKRPKNWTFSKVPKSVGKLSKKVQNRSKIPKSVGKLVKSVQKRAKSPKKCREIVKNSLFAKSRQLVVFLVSKIDPLKKGQVSLKIDPLLRSFLSICHL